MGQSRLRDCGFDGGRTQPQIVAPEIDMAIGMAIALFLANEGARIVARPTNRSETR